MEFLGAGLWRITSMDALQLRGLVFFDEAYGHLSVSTYSNWSMRFHRLAS
jgi:hypothetical protein